MFEQLIQDLAGDNGSLYTGLKYFSAELWLSGTIVVMLLLRLFSVDRWIPTFAVALAGSAIALWGLFGQFTELMTANTDVSIAFFGDMLRQDLFSVFFRMFLSLFLILTIALTVLTGIPDNEDAPDFYALLFGATVGMMMMASANNLLMLFLGVEMASVPSYVMVGFLKGRKPSSEAALKYVVYGAGAAGVMLYGISLVTGVLGTGDMTLLASRLALVSDGVAGLGDPEVCVVALGIMMVLAGLAFKLSLVPFHFWCPDAFEGASAEVAGFLSVASKAGAFALLVRFCLGLSGVEATAELMTAFGVALGAVAIVTATFGNLAAYTQNNLKRLLSYSTIAHAGYMLMAVAAMMVMQNSDQAAGLGQEINAAVGGLLYYLAVYMFMNLGAFAIIALVRNYTFDESIDSIRGLSSQSPALAVGMGVCVFSLIGIPPFGGFFAKLMVFAAVLKSAEIHWFMYVVLAFGGLNTVFSLFYYLKIVKAIFIEERPAEARAVTLPSMEGLYVVVLAVMVTLLGFFPAVTEGLSSIANAAGNAVLSVVGG
ncbi:MAG: NADH-quinone oxidoreductase subunit N [Planctomycetaceae bacterium]|nr:NADH-quinone oxidoreductase subunit N [Planctomycetaceae bacterium]